MNRFVSTLIKNYKLRRLDRMVRDMRKRISEDCVDDCVRYASKCEVADCPLIKLRKEYEKRKQDDTVTGNGVRAVMRDHNKGKPDTTSDAR
jgi:hypothetical protein